MESVIEKVRDILLSQQDSSFAQAQSLLNDLRSREPVSFQRETCDQTASSLAVICDTCAAVWDRAADTAFARREIEANEIHAFLNLQFELLAVLSSFVRWELSADNNIPKGGKVFPRAVFRLLASISSTANLIALPVEISTQSFTLLAIALQRDEFFAKSFAARDLRRAWLQLASVSTKNGEFSRLHCLPAFLDVLFCTLGKAADSSSSSRALIASEFLTDFLECNNHDIGTFDVPDAHQYITVAQKFITQWLGNDYRELCTVQTVVECMADIVWRRELDSGADLVALCVLAGIVLCFGKPTSAEQNAVRAELIHTVEKFVQYETDRAFEFESDRPDRRRTVVPFVLFVLQQQNVLIPAAVPRRGMLLSATFMHEIFLQSPVMWLSGCRHHWTDPATSLHDFLASLNFQIVPQMCRFVTSSMVKEDDSFMVECICRIKTLTLMVVSQLCSANPLALDLPIALISVKQTAIHNHDDDDQQQQQQVLETQTNVFNRTLQNDVDALFRTLFMSVILVLEVCLDGIKETLNDNENFLEVHSDTLQCIESLAFCSMHSFQPYQHVLQLMRYQHRVLLSKSLHVPPQPSVVVESKSSPLFEWHTQSLRRIHDNLSALPCATLHLDRLTITRLNFNLDWFDSSLRLTSEALSRVDHDDRSLVQYEMFLDEQVFPCLFHCLEWIRTDFYNTHHRHTAYIDLVVHSQNVLHSIFRTVLVHRNRFIILHRLRSSRVEETPVVLQVLPTYFSYLVDTYPVQTSRRQLLLGYGTVFGVLEELEKYSSVVTKLYVFVLNAVLDRTHDMLVNHNNTSPSSESSSEPSPEPSLRSWLLIAMMTIKLVPLSVLPLLLSRLELLVDRIESPETQQLFFECLFDTVSSYMPVDRHHKLTRWYMTLPERKVCRPINSL